MSHNDKLKRFRREFRKQRTAVQLDVIASYRSWVCSLSLRERLVLAWKVVRKTL